MMVNETQSSHGPLAGVTVLDFTQLVPGPIAGLMLAEAGAAVIKIEPADGEAMRAPPPAWGDLSALFALVNRGKRSLALDLKDAATRERLLPLIAGADVLLEGFRPGVMARLGLDYAAARAINPRIVYCAITGYGQSGAKAMRPGHDLNYIAETGLLALSAGAPEQPTIPPVLIADLMGGAYPAVMAVVMALFRRERTGQGAFLDISMTQGLFLPMFWAWAQGLAGEMPGAGDAGIESVGGEHLEKERFQARHPQDEHSQTEHLRGEHVQGGNWPASGGHVFTGASPRYQLYRACDGGLLAVGALEDKFWAAFCDAIGLAADLRDDNADPRRVIAAVAERIAAQPTGHWRDIFSRAECCVSVVEGLREALRDAHFAGLTTAGTAVSGARAIPALPMPFASLLTSDGGARAAPELGEANEAFGFAPLPARLRERDQK